MKLRSGASRGPGGTAGVGVGDREVARGEMDVRACWTETSSKTKME